MTHDQQQLQAAIILLFIFAMFCGAIMVLFVQLIAKAITCTHTKKVTRTFWTATSCEETADFCADCGTQLSETKIDCR